MAKTAKKLKFSILGLVIVAVVDWLGSFEAGLGILTLLSFIPLIAGVRALLLVALVFVQAGIAKAFRVADEVIYGGFLVNLLFAVGCLFSPTVTARQAMVPVYVILWFAALFGFNVLQIPFVRKLKDKGVILG